MPNREIGSCHLLLCNPSATESRERYALSRSTASDSAKLGGDWPWFGSSNPGDFGRRTQRHSARIPRSMPTTRAAIVPQANAATNAPPRSMANKIILRPSRLSFHSSRLPQHFPFPTPTRPLRGLWCVCRQNDRNPATARAERPNSQWKGEAVAVTCEARASAAALPTTSEGISARGRWKTGIGKSSTAEGEESAAVSAVTTSSEDGVSVAPERSSSFGLALTTAAS